MAWARKGRKTTKAKGKKLARRRQVRRSGTSEWASASQTIKTANDSMGTIYSLNSIALANFDRLSIIGRAYQYFRFTHCEVRLKPLADTFQMGGSGQVPYAYWLVNKGENLVVDSFDSLRDAGAKPIRFDDKTVVIRYKPAVLQFIRDIDPAGTRVANFGMTRTSPWLSTNDLAGQNPNVMIPSSVEHSGILYGVDGGNQDTQVYSFEMTVHCQFKKPLNNPGASRLDPAPVVEKKVTAE